jgi:hypothetical protein
MKIKNFPLYSLALFLTLTSCGRKKVNISDETNEPIPKCSYSYYDGNPAKMPSFSNIQTLSFKKRIDISPLDDIANASAYETVEYIETYLEADVYRSNDTLSGVGCLDENNEAFFKDLKVAPHKLLSVWDKASWTTSSTSVMLGLYKPKTDPDIVNLSDNAIIFTHPEAGRWTLVHELMHHLFRQQSFKDTSITDEELITNLEATAEEYNKKLENFENQTASTANDLQILLVMQKKLVLILKEYLVRFPLEEATIEKELIKRLRTSKISYLEGKSLSSASWYLQSSLEKASDFLEEVIKEFEKLGTLTRIHGESGAFNRNMQPLKALERSILFSQSIINQSKKSNLSFSSNQVDDHPEITCSRHGAMDKRVEKFFAKQKR